jgi:hypothetical protein
MGFFMVVNDAIDDLTSTSGWGRFIDWTEGLDLERFEEVVRLAEHGHSTDLERLAVELQAALAIAPPRRRYTEEIARAILSAVLNGEHE